MMQGERFSDQRVDESIRSAFDPSIAGVRRVTSAALAAADGVSVRGRAGLYAAFTGAVVVCLFVTSIILKTGSPPKPETPTSPSLRRGIVISNSEGIVTAATADGQLIAIVSGGIQ